MVLINGPVSIYYLKKKDKRIYLFGDEHYSTSGTCINKSIDIIDFFEKIFTSGLYKDNIDFYLESHYSDVEKYTKEKKLSFFNKIKKNIYGDTSHSYLLKIINYYKSKGCFMKKDRECKKIYPNVTFHPADFRRSIKCKYTKSMEEYTMDLYILLIYVNNNHDINNYIKKLKKFNNYQKVKNRIKMSLKCNVIQKQIKKCNKKYRIIINKYINDSLKKYDTLFKNLYNENINKIILGIKNKKKIFSISEITSQISEVLGIVIYMNSIVMDIYLLSRLFKEDKKLVFIYAGNAHIQNYVNFLQKYNNFKIISGGIAHKKRCIEAKKLY